MQGLLADLKDYIFLLPGIVISLTVHEFSHAFMAHRLGDPTPKEDGRLSLNPLRHIDPMGFLVMLLVRFGWAKPVRINPLYFQNPRKGMLYTAIAGPVSNIILAILSSFLLFWAIVFNGPAVLVEILIYLVLLNIGLAVFNLIPIYPFDGSRVLGYFSPRFASFMTQNANVVQLVFVAAILLPRFLPIPDIIGTVIGTVQRGSLHLLMQLWSSVFWFL